MWSVMPMSLRHVSQFCSGWAYAGRWLLHSPAACKDGPQIFYVTCTSPNMSPEPSLEQKQEINYTKS